MTLVRNVVFHTRLAAVLGVALTLSACNVLQTNNSEQVKGRGAKAIDPYASTKSGALRLALQWFKGCATLANGRPIEKGQADIPYPDTCVSYIDQDTNFVGAIPPTPTQFKLVAGQKYFLDELTLMDSTISPTGAVDDSVAAVDWMEHDSAFSDLDWTGLQVQNKTTDVEDFESVLYSVETFFGNAAWQQNQWTFKVELLDASLKVRQTVNYSRADFLAENPIGGHTRISHKANLLAVDSTQPSGFAASGNTSFNNSVRIDLATTTAAPTPDRLIEPSVLGDGAIRVTWSEMPNKPFYFPITVISQADVPSECYDDSGQKVQCGFGIEPKLHLSKPENGQFYKAGDSFNVYVDLQDEGGKHLHAPDTFPSFATEMSDVNSGLLYFSPAMTESFGEHNAEPVINIVGPVQDLNKPVDPAAGPEYYSLSPGYYQPLADPSAAYDQIPGLPYSRWPTEYQIHLPDNAKPGTYVALVKANRQFLGERTVKGKAFMFQVGQTEVTRYPGRVGNCQICHRGALSLDNVRHGFSVDNVEACVACHADGAFDITRMIHEIHFLSSKYPLPRNDCTVCHLTKESATRPTYDTCTACHPVVHAGEFDQTKVTLSGPGSRYENCAQTCHVTNTPKLHILPAQ